MKGESGMKELVLEARRDNLNEVLGCVDEELEKLDCPIKTQMTIDIAVEEIYINIASYAYRPGTGNAVIRIEVEDDPMAVMLTFIDSGMPYNPLDKEDPDITLAAEDRQIGGLGIFMVKKSMDDVTYEYKDGKNNFTIKKYI